MEKFFILASTSPADQVRPNPLLESVVLFFLHFLHTGPHIAVPINPIHFWAWIKAQTRIRYALFSDAFGILFFGINRLKNGWRRISWLSASLARVFWNFFHGVVFLCDASTVCAMAKHDLRCLQCRPEELVPR